MNTTITKLIKGAILVVLISVNTSIFAQQTQRPFIWARADQRDAILSKIENQSWAKEYYTKFVERVQDDLKEYEANRDEYLKKMPYDFKNRKQGKVPPFLHLPVPQSESAPNISANEMIMPFFHYVQTATDCGVIYYLSGDEKYAQYAADILNNVVLGLVETTVAYDNLGTGGWIYPQDHLRELRYVSCIPIIYDFVKPYIDKGKKAYNIATQKYEDFAQSEAQIVFETYAKIAVLHGHTGSNWSVLESPALAQCALAIEDMTLRDKYIKHYLTESTDRQESLKDIATAYKFEGDIYPETSQYSGGVAGLSTQLMYIMTMYDPSLHLGQKYSNIPWSLPRWGDLIYPNGEIILLGDGKRTGGGSVSSYETAYALGKLDNVQKLTTRFGALINEAQTKDGYQRPTVKERGYGVNPYSDPTDLLWSADKIDGDIANSVLPRTDRLRHAGVFIQRNPSSTDRAEDGLMLFVGGAGYVHGHASGMNIELYGKGEVLGSDAGIPGYGKDDHENYARLFAAHNTVIVNGASCSDGGWVNLGINTVEKVAMEPESNAEALSPLYSYSKTSFVDDKGDRAEAIQERTLSVIRTSPTTGYYLDIYRSKSSLPNEYHDYLYHNISDELSFIDKDNNPTFKPDSQRYMANANEPWLQNRQYRHPGWHWFENVKSSGMFTDDVNAIFRTKEIRGKSLNMKLFIPGAANREYTTVSAPYTFYATEPYNKRRTPTLVIRKQGEAWNAPFVVVFEPTEGKTDDGSVVSVDNIMQNGIFKGVKVVSLVNGKSLTQYIISQDKNEIFEDKALKMSITGGFAIITIADDSKLENIYLGETKDFRFAEVTVNSADMMPIDAYIDFSTSTPTVKTNGNANINVK